MEKLERSQLFKLVLLALFVLLLTPFVSSWMKPSILFLLLNLLILALGAESGIFTNFTKKIPEEKPSTTVVFCHKEIKQDDKIVDDVAGGGHGNDGGDVDSKFVDKQSGADKFVKVFRVRSKVRKCPSTPSLFFIDDRIDQKEEEEKIDEADDLNAQELFAKAESFIGNFYKQLKMQREESWKKIHGLYRRPI